MKTVRMYVAAFDHGEHKKGARLEKLPEDAPENAFVPIQVEVEDRPTRKPSHDNSTPEGDKT